MQKVLFTIFLSLNILTFFIYAFDKYRSVKSKWHISEKELHAFALIGGFLGASLAMMLLRHKTNKARFLAVHSFILLLWIGGVLFYFTQIDILNFLR